MEFNTGGNCDISFSAASESILLCCVFVFWLIFFFYSLWAISGFANRFFAREGEEVMRGFKALFLLARNLLQPNLPFSFLLFHKIPIFIITFFFVTLSNGQSLRMLSLLFLPLSYLSGFVKYWLHHTSFALFLFLIGGDVAVLCVYLVAFFSLFVFCPPKLTWPDTCMQCSVVGLGNWMKS